jgi:hypothetical protein
LFANEDLVVLRASRQDRTVGMHLYLCDRDVVHFHLSAFSQEGYRHDASHALCWSALEHLRNQARWLNWGGAPGLDDSGANGLARFKAGWATTTRSAWLLGAVLDPGCYRRLGDGRRAEGFFPAYRAGEFAGAVDPERQRR